jgi:phosphatidylglycerophosphate synthase
VATAAPSRSRGRWQQHLPRALTTSRVLLGAIIVALAYSRSSGAALVACVIVALVSDIFDGILARRYGVETAELRRYDSIADTIFYAGVMWATWVLYPSVVRERAALLVGLLALEITRYIFDWMKFRREASYHSLLAKAWGLALAGTVIGLLGWGYAGVPLTAALVLGIVVDTEGLLISLLLPRWHHDVKSVLHAWRIRRAEAAPQ